MFSWSPKQIVEELDRYIIGQPEAKKAVAVALRNRYRRSKLDEQMREEITPKNIIMMGPTGCGKTEIARRLAKLVEAPFVKVEATKFTEVGYVGRDVDSIVRDLIEASIRLVKSNKQEQVQSIADNLAEKRLVKHIVPIKKREARSNSNPLEMLFGAQQSPEETLTVEEKTYYSSKREEVEVKLKAGLLEDDIIEIEVDEKAKIGMDMGHVGMDINVNDLLGDMLPKRKKKRKMKVSQARKILAQEEVEKLIDMDDVIAEAVERAEQDGIVFIDEIDKIAGKNVGGGPGVSREGVQRDLLPIVEGSTITTKYGPIKTDFILFIAAGAFHVSKVSDLIPELQGRFPITVELSSLTKEDFVKIMTQTDNAIIKQYGALLSVDNINLKFTDDALEEIADLAFKANDINENIGARRLHTVMENLLQDIAFNASGEHPMIDLVIDEQYVKNHLGDQIDVTNLSKYLI